MKANYRSKLGIYLDVLLTISNAGQSGTQISKICRQSNISHYVARDILVELVKTKTVELNIIDRSESPAGIHKDEGIRTYRLTSLGWDILGRLQDLERICINSLGMHGLS